MKPCLSFTVALLCCNHVFHSTAYGKHTLCDRFCNFYFCCLCDVEGIKNCYQLFFFKVEDKRAFFNAHLRHKQTIILQPSNESRSVNKTFSLDLLVSIHSFIQLTIQITFHLQTTTNSLKGKSLSRKPFNSQTLWDTSFGLQSHLADKQRRWFTMKLWLN